MKEFMKYQVNKVWCLTKLTDSEKALIPFTANSKIVMQNSFSRYGLDYNSSILRTVNKGIFALLKISKGK